MGGPQTQSERVEISDSMLGMFSPCWPWWLVKRLSQG